MEIDMINGIIHTSSLGKLTRYKTTKNDLANRRNLLFLSFFPLSVFFQILRSIISLADRFYSTSIIRWSFLVSNKKKLEYLKFKRTEFIISVLDFIVFYSLAERKKNGNLKFMGYLIKAQRQRVCMYVYEYEDIIIFILEDFTS